MSESTATKSNVYVEDLALATGGTGADETGDRETSTGGTITLTKIDSKYIKFQTLAKSLDDLVDGGQDVTIKPLNIDAGGTLTVTGATTLSALSAGFVQSSAAGLLSSAAMTPADLPTAQDAIKIADGSVSNTEFQYLNGATSNIQDQIDAIIAGGAKLAGDTVQIVYSQDGAVATGSTAIPGDNTKPQVSEGDEYLSLAITPTKAGNNLKIDVVLNISLAAAAGGCIAAALFNADFAATDALAVGAASTTSTYEMVSIKYTHYIVGASTPLPLAATTFSVRCGANSGTTTFNGVGGAGLYNTTLASSITISEIEV